MSIVKRFAEECLNNISYPKEPTSWHVEGMLKNRSNELLKFDVRGMSKISENRLEKKGNIYSKADKMVFETNKHWVIFDKLEINKYIKQHKIKDLLFEDLLSNLEWNTVIPKA